MASYSGLFQPAPIATSTRPPDSTSMLARSWASTAGCRRSLLWTNADSRRVDVAAATVAIAMVGESWESRWSGITTAW
jgi:hypothetical protein